MKFLIILLLILIPIEVFGGGLKKNEPIKIYIIDTGFVDGQGVPKEVVHLHDTGHFKDGLARGGATHGIGMTKIYYDKLKDKIESGEVELHSINATDANGDFSNSSINEAMALARMENANIVNMSFGVSDADELDLEMLNAVNELSSDGTIVLKAAGNEGNGVEGDKFFDNLSNSYSIISVGALDSTNNNNTIIDYSSGQSTGMIDVYTTSVTRNGGTSSATAYTGATIANEFLNNNIKGRYDKNDNGELDVYEIRSFISSPDISDKDNIIGADKAQYKTLVSMGYKYDSENGNFYLPGNNGAKNNTITSLVLHELEDDEMIEYKMTGFKKERDNEGEKQKLVLSGSGISEYFVLYEKNLEKYDTYGKIGSNIGIFKSEITMSNMDAAYSKKIYSRGLTLAEKNWYYAKDAGLYVYLIEDDEGHWSKSKLIISIEQVKNGTEIEFERALRIGDLIAVGYQLEKDGVVAKDGKKYPFEYVDDDDRYIALLDKSYEVKDSTIKPTVKNINQNATTSNPITNNRTQSQNTVNQNMSKNTNSKTGLVPCGKAGDPCTMCDLAVGINEIIKFITSLVFVAATLVIVIAGIMYITSAGNTSTTEMAKTAIKNALIGSIIVLASFVIIHFILKALFVTDTGDLTGATTSSSSWSFKCN